MEYGSFDQYPIDDYSTYMDYGAYMGYGPFDGMHHDQKLYVNIRVLEKQNFGWRYMT